MWKLFSALWVMRLRLMVVVGLFILISSQSVHARGVTQSQLSRLDPRVESTSVLLETSKELLKNEQLEDALPFLKEILIRLEGDEEKKARQTKAFTLYQLAHCQMKLGDYDLAADNFINFCAEFPDDMQMESARVLAAQSLTMIQRWPEVEEQSGLVLENVRLGDELKVPATQLLAESRYQQEKWKEAIKPLSTLFRIAKKDTVRAGAAVMLVTCYVRLDDFSNLFKFLPHCDEAARHDVGLNVALLEAGDSHYNKREYQKALLLYRLVLLKQDLIEHYENRLRSTKLTIKPFVAGTSLTLSDYKDQQMKQQKLFDRLRKQYDVITNFQDYDMDVALRTAQCYNDLERNWPAHAIYKRIYSESPDSGLADQSRFSAFAVMLDEKEWSLATSEGYEYIRKLPEGEFLDDITLNLLQVHMQQEQFDLAFDMGEKAIELSPDHKHIDQVKYLMGYIRFISLDYPIAADFFLEILQKWPDSRYYESAEYWRSMSLLFSGSFADAEAAFKGYLTNPKYEPRVYAEDASYRVGIAQYGVEKYEESEGSFRLFIDAYPESKMVSEAYAMLGDLRAAEGDLMVALDFYQMARDKAGSLPQINYPLFQAAKVLELEKRYEEIVELMDAYLEEWGVRGDFANVANWKGRAYKAMDEYTHALDAYFDAIDAYGNDADLSGVDLILRAILDDYKSDEWAAYQSVITDRLDTHLKRAFESGQRALELRYQTLFAEVSEGAEREAYVNLIVKSKNVPAAGSRTLVLIAREGVKRGDFEIVHDATRRFVGTFDISNDMLYIMMADLDALIEEKSYDAALDLSEEILLKFGYASKSVGYARKRRGDVFRYQGNHEEALEAYKEVLSIREWRGALTPEALFCSGLSKMELGKYEDAFAYFQRIYVLYEDYTQWVAPAYENSIKCMEIIGGYDQDIINTYREMLGNDTVAATDEGKRAAKRLGELDPVGVLP